MMPPCPPFFATFPIPLTIQPATPNPLSESPSNGGSTVLPQPLAFGEEDDHEEDHVELHDNDKANLFVEFDHTVKSPGTWDPLLK